MTYVFQSEAAAVEARAPGVLRRFAGALRDAVNGLRHELAGAWRYAAARREFHQLDAGTLRDLGMSRSEFDSYWAETHGQAEQTRTRVIRNLRQRYGL